VPPQTTTTSRPGRLLLTLVMLIVVLLLGVLAGSMFQPSNWHKRFKVDLGLDLSGGTVVTLKAVPPEGTNEVPPSDLATAVSIMSSRVSGGGFNGATVVPEGSNLINVTVPGKSAQQVANLVGTTAQLRFREVLLTAPNYSTSSTPSATPTPSASPTPSSSSGQKLATTTDPAAQGQASLLTAATKAQFDKLNCADSNWRTQIYGTNPNNWDNPGIQTVACYQGQKYALDKSTVTGEMLKIGGSSTQLQTNGNWWVNLTFNGQGTQAFGALSTKMYDNYYNASSGQPSSELDYFAMMLDGSPVSVPYMGAVLDSGTATIQGSFTHSQAGNLANILNYGALPLSFVPQQAQSISPQLGSYYLHAGLLAGLVGLVLVVTYAFFYYRGLGIVAVSSLAIAALVSYLAVVLLSLYESFALSLAGIAGLIVAIGTTADSFVVFFERLRDEVREGKSLRVAVERGWQRARRTILVSDTVSFIAAAVLYKFAVTDVQNFAFTLGLTTLVDVVVVFLFTKPTITLLARTEFFGGGHKLSGLDPARLGARSPWRGTRRPAARQHPGRAQPGSAQAERAPGESSRRDPAPDQPEGGMMSRLGAIRAVPGRLYRGEVSIEFVGRRKLWYTISGLILVISIVALGGRGLNYSVEFKGGNVFQFQAPRASSSQIASVVKGAGGGSDPIVQQLTTAGGQTSWQVQTTSLTLSQQNKVAATIATGLHVSGGANAVSTQLIGPSWGTQISHKALEGLIAFLILILIYLSIAFESKMAVAAFFALLHDIVITTGVYALAGFQVSPATVIGLLTILGYSLYDTVVVFDKVRENTAGLLATDQSTYSQAANLALNQTLVRSINTSLIALLPVTAILITSVTLLRTGELQDLGLVLFVGMLSGTYSSICIATPVLAALKEREPPYKQLAARVTRRASGTRAAQRAARAAKAGAAGRGAPDTAAGRGEDAVGVAAPGAGPGADVAADAGVEPDDDYDEAVAGAAEADSGEPVPAVRAAGGGSPRVPRGARSTPRQQPRWSSAARRRPAGKKKRR
jgi:protein-export membrane protein SecD/preprotein translocase SecF subunit